MSQPRGKRPASSYPSRPPPTKKQFQEAPKGITISGLVAGVATFEATEYEFPSESTIQLPANSSILLPSSAGYVTPKNGTVVYLPSVDKPDKEVRLSQKATLVAPGDGLITIGTLQSNLVGIPGHTGVTCGNTLNRPEPLKQAIKLNHKLTLPSELTLSPRGPTTLPGELCLSQRPHIGGSSTINNGIRLQPGIINLPDSLELLDDTKLGGTLIIMRSITIKKEIKLAGRLRLINEISVPVATDIAKVTLPSSNMQVDPGDKTKRSLPVGSILPAGFVVPSNVQLESTTILPKGTILPAAFSFPPGSIIPAGTQLPANTVVPGGAVLPENMELQVGTILPVTADK